MFSRLALALISSATISNAATIVEHEWTSAGLHVSANFVHDGASVTFHSLNYHPWDYFVEATATGLNFFYYDGVDVYASSGSKPTQKDPFGWGYFRRDYYYFFVGFNGILEKSVETSIEPQCERVIRFTNKPCPDYPEIYSYYSYHVNDLVTERGTWTPNLPFVAPIPLPTSAAFMILGIFSLLPLKRLMSKLK